MDPDIPSGRPTSFATTAGRFHLFVSYVPGAANTHRDWGGQRHILHYTSADLVALDVRTARARSRRTTASIRRSSGVPMARGACGTRTKAHGSMTLRGGEPRSEGVGADRGSRRVEALRRRAQGVCLRRLVLADQGPQQRARRLPIGRPRHLDLPGQDPRRARQAQQRRHHRQTRRRRRLRRARLHHLLHAPLHGERAAAQRRVAALEPAHGVAGRRTRGAATGSWSATGTSRSGSDWCRPT